MNEISKKIEQEYLVPLNQENKINITDIPVDIIKSIFKNYLRLNDLLENRLVCKQWKLLINEISKDTWHVHREKQNLEEYYTEKKPNSFTFNNYDAWRITCLNVNDTIYHCFMQRIVTRIPDIERNYQSVQVIMEGVYKNGFIDGKKETDLESSKMIEEGSFNKFESYYELNGIGKRSINDYTIEGKFKNGEIIKEEVIENETHDIQSPIVEKRNRDDDSDGVVIKKIKKFKGKD